MVIRTRQYLAALIPQDEVLVLNTLRYADEIKAVGELGLPSSALKGPKVTAKEIDMALRLVDDMSEDWEPEKYKDSYRHDLLARIREKIKKGQTEEVTEPEEGEKEAAGAEVIDLMALLRKSVEQKQEKPKRSNKAKRRAA